MTNRNILPAPGPRVSRGFLSDRRGVAAVEFAIILPLMLLAYLGSFDITRGVTMARKAGLASETMSALVAEQQTGVPLTGSQIASLVAASAATMAPYSSSALTTTVSAIDLKARTDGSCCDATVNWSFTNGGTLRPCNVVLTQVADGTSPSTSTIPSSIATPPAAILAQGTQPTAVVITDVAYRFTPISPAVDLLISTTIKRSSYDFPRLSGQVTLASPVSAPNGYSGVVCS